MTSNGAGEQKSSEANLASDSVRAAGAVGGHDRLTDAPIDKAQHLFELAGLAASMGDFRLAARLYKNARDWTAAALREGTPLAQGNDTEGS